MSHRSWSAGLALLLSACFSLPEFADSSLVDRPRVLSVVASPPEVVEGSGVSLTVLIAGAQDVQVSWSACARYTPFGQGNQYGENSGDQGCGDDRMVLATGPTVSIPPALTQVFFQSDEDLRDALGALLPGFELDELRQSIGVAFSIEADIQADGKHLRALKRILVRDTDQPHSNPPPPSFRFGDRLIQGFGEPAAFSCRPEGEGGVHVTPGEHVQLAPVVDGEQEPWLESYTVLDARGELGAREERAFYAWFASAGTLDRNNTRAPDRDNEWIAPEASGCQRLWLVVRDGHGGESACELPVAVGDVDDCGPRANSG